MNDDLSEALQPVFLEPRDEYWEVHTPEQLSMDQQQSYHLAAWATAEQLENTTFCNNCFPETARTIDDA